MAETESSLRNYMDARFREINRSIALLTEADRRMDKRIDSLTTFHAEEKGKLKAWADARAAVLAFLVLASPWIMWGVQILQGWAEHKKLVP
jgi:hypothetical protein